MIESTRPWAGKILPFDQIKAVKGDAQGKWALWRHVLGIENHLFELFLLDRKEGGVIPYLGEVAGNLLSEGKRNRTLSPSTMLSDITLRIHTLPGSKTDISFREKAPGIHVLEIDSPSALRVLDRHPTMGWEWTNYLSNPLLDDSWGAGSPDNVAFVGPRTELQHKFSREAQENARQYVALGDPEYGERLMYLSLPRVDSGGVESHHRLKLTFLDPEKLSGVSFVGPGLTGLGETRFTLSRTAQIAPPSSFTQPLELPYIVGQKDSALTIHQGVGILKTLGGRGLSAIPVAATPDVMTKVLGDYEYHAAPTPKRFPSSINAPDRVFSVSC